MAPAVVCVAGMWAKNMSTFSVFMDMLRRYVHGVDICWTRASGAGYYAVPSNSQPQGPGGHWPWRVSGASASGET